MAPKRREFLILGGVGAGAALIGGLIGALALQTGNGTAQLLGTSFPVLQGGTRRVADWAGHAVVCNFWAAWCAPCREEIPLLNAAQERYAGQGLQVVGIAVDSAANVAEFTKATTIAFPVLIAGAAAIDLMKALGNPGGALPFTVLLDRQGRLVQQKLGAYSQDELKAAVRRLLG